VNYLKSTWHVTWAGRYLGIYHQGSPLALVGGIAWTRPHSVNFDMENWNLNWRFLNKLRTDSGVNFFSFNLGAEIIDLELDLLLNNPNFQSAMAAKLFKLAQNKLDIWNLRKNATRKCQYHFCPTHQFGEKSD
jgi:hypothetical protein